MIVALAGRRIDATGAPVSRFPPALADTVRQKLLTSLSLMSAKHLVCSGACGADLLALQAAGELGITTTMILPFDVNTFKSTSVTDRPGNWGSIYDKLIMELKGSNGLIELQHDKEDPEVYRNTNFRILDEAQKIAGQTNSHHADSGSAGNLAAFIVWEGRSKDADDTTYHFMQEAKKRNFIIKEILSNER